MKYSAQMAPALLGVLLLASGAKIVHANDGIFPPAPAAASSINFDGRGFLIHGKRTFIASGGMEYSRIPRALWRDRLLRLKRAGFNTVEMYNMWNYHEPRKGQFDFSGDHDLDAFLKLVNSLGLYAIMRVGPYVCAEWDSGGFPVWLRFEPGVRVREANPQFLADLDRYWGKLLPIIAANQINHGGPVILAQLENEHVQGGGTEMPNAYFTHMRDTALSLGLQVPYFFSGLNHGGDPGRDKPWSSKGRTSPWMTTEFWSVNFDRYGQTLEDANTYERRMWTVIAHGGNGLNFYMLHGGTNFGYTNNDEDSASYDYGSAIGQAGDLRPTYYRFKRAALFARSFESVLEDSDNSTDAYQSSATGAGVVVTARTAPAGTILFLDNSGKETVQTQVKESDGSLFPASGTLTLAPGQLAPVVHDYALTPDITLERSTPLLGVLTQGAVTTLVANGSIGDAAELRFRPVSPAADLSDGFVKGDGNQLILRTAVTAGTKEFTFRAGERTIRVLVMSNGLAERTWFVDDKIVVGPSYIGDLTMRDGKVSLVGESKDGVFADSVFYGPDGGGAHELTPAPTAAAMPAAPALGPWRTLPADAQAAPRYSDAAWKAGVNPPPMGADGDTGAYAWYRTSVNLPKAGDYKLKFTDGGDWASVFVEGKHAASAPVSKGVPLTLPAGTSRLAILTAHYGRPKQFGYMGPLDTIYAKGLSGPVFLDRAAAAGPSITAWRVQTGVSANKTAPPTDTTGAGWADGSAGPDAFHGGTGFVWYVATLPALAGAYHRLHFENVDDNATVFLNGKQVADHQGWGAPFDAPLDAAWRTDGANMLAVLVENISGPGGIQGPVTLEAVNAGDEVGVTGWRMRGGVPEPKDLTGWKADAAPVDGSPAFYRTTFDVTPPAKTGPHPILRVATTGLSRGFVWLNGHNLGRYPEKLPVDGLYLPECWQIAGRNELVIFDEEGRAPDQVKLWTEMAASRIAALMAER